MPETALPPAAKSLRWEILCRVIDNHGDLGVCWRLACDLARHGQQVRLWVDDDRALRWMAPDGPPPGVQCRAWPEVSLAEAAPLMDLGEVVIEAFGCEPPALILQAILRADQPPVWVNLEYLSAEDYVERSHRLRSPQRLEDADGEVHWRDKWFFYPGFTPATGGLLREHDLADRQAAFDASGWRAAQCIHPAPGERVVSLFCYDNPQLPSLLAALAAEQPTLLLTAPGPATTCCEALTLPPGLRGQPLPWLSQREYDHLLWACDLNLVRGEDSFVRAQWAGRPFLWQIYPQDDGVHAGKLDAFLARHLASARAPLAAAVRSAMHAWNGLRPAGFAPLPAAAEWAALARRWREDLGGQPPLVTQLLDFVAQKR